MSSFEIPDNNDGFDDPLAVRTGLWADGIPAEGWPEKAKPEVIGKLLSYMPEDDSELVS